MMEINGLAYALWTAGAVLLGLALFALAGRKLGRGARAWTAALALPLGLLGARAFYVLARLEFFVEIGGWNWLWPEDMFSDWGVATGFALWGAVGGCALAACLAGRITGQRTADILDALQRDETVWANYQQFSEPYRRIRVAYIEAARERPEEFQKRLHSFLEKTRQNKRIMGYGGIEKYYD